MLGDLTRFILSEELMLVLVAVVSDLFTKSEVLVRLVVVLFLLVVIEVVFFALVSPFLLGPNSEFSESSEKFCVSSESSNMELCLEVALAFV